MMTERVDRFRGTARCPGGRAGFTLTEMLVALAVMVVAMAVVTDVFSVTTKTAATSAAIAEVEGLARDFALQIQQDLEHCDPARSVLVIHGRTQAAALTEDLRQGGQYYRVLVGDTAGEDEVRPKYDATPPPEYSDPRADLLMFITQRPMPSQAPAINPIDQFQQALQRGVKAAPALVVYGHAAIDTAVQSGGTWTFADNLTHIETNIPTDMSPLPLTRWHLARRATILSVPPPNGMLIANAPRFMGSATGVGGQQEFPRVLRCVSDTNWIAGDTSRPFRYEQYLQCFSPNPPISGISPLALKSPYGFFDLLPGTFNVDPTMRWTQGESHLVNDVLYPNNGNPTNHHVATIVENPPAELQDNLGVQQLPGCAWFQVEFLMPEDPRNGLDHPLPKQRLDTPRWVEVEPGQTYVFVPDTDENRALVESQVWLSGVQVGRPLPNPNRLRDFMQVIPPTPPTVYNGPDTAGNRQVRMWPYAIRVTVHVVDRRGRLENPIVRTIVHRFD